MTFYSTICKTSTNESSKQEFKDYLVHTQFYKEGIEQFKQKFKQNRFAKFINNALDLAIDLN